MRISDYYNLNKSQYELDFVDIDPSIDTPLFLDPYFISKCDFPFATNAYATLRSYFEYLLALLRGKKFSQAEELFSNLGESNEICLGMSRGKPRGRGMGPEDTRNIFEQLLQSKALQSGVMEDIEDFRIFVPNVDKDKVSDMTANIIKAHLIKYTQEQCLLHGITLTDNVPSGMYWAPSTKTWTNQYTARLIIAERPILLVPKRVVSFSDKYTSSEYKQHFILNFLQHEHLRLQTSLVRQYKSKNKRGEKYVTKRSIIETENTINKDYLVKFTEQHPEVFADFKQQTSKKIRAVGGNVFDNTPVRDICNYLITELDVILPGADAASRYHSLIVGILELLLYPSLTSPKKEAQIHDGRKRIDITFNNSAERGFFFTLTNKNIQLPCPFLFVECKNYTGEVSNPELDQLSGRFSNKRGRVGILVCRNLEKNNLFIQKCADTYHDDRGLIIPITDSDLRDALSEFSDKGTKALEDILESKYRIITFS